MRGAVSLSLCLLVRSAGAAGTDSTARTAAVVSPLLESFGPQYIVSVRPTTAVDMERLTALTQGMINTMDTNGRDYSCELPKLNTASTAATAGTTAAPKAKAAIVDPTTAVAKAINALRGTCATKKTGWWTYEVCHFTEVRQYHEENKKIDAVQNWSLGKIKSPVALGIFSPASSGVRAHAKHPFAGGQVCEESNTPRSGTVHYECRSDNAVVKAALNAKGATLVEITEPSTCTYQISVHVPELCPIADFKPPANAMPSESDSPTAVAKLYRERCFYRSEGWWTYELCVNKHVRQFRQEPGKAGPATAAAKESGPEFVLGYSKASEQNYVPKVHAKDPTRSFAHAQYTGGSECDLRVSGGELRQTEVRMKCAADGADRIVSVQEVATCKYRLVFASAKLCALSDFKIREDKPREIICYYGDDEEVEAAAEAEAAAAAEAAKPAPPPRPPPSPPPPVAKATPAQAAAQASKKTAAAASARVAAAAANPAQPAGTGSAASKASASAATAKKVAAKKAAAAATGAGAGGAKTAQKRQDGKTVQSALQEEMEVVQALTVPKIKQELIERGLDPTGMVEKVQMVEALAQARVEGVQAFMPGGGAPTKYEAPLNTARHMAVTSERVATIMGKLRNTCSKANMGWWTFSVCHFEEVSQWHEENGVAAADASWSLGLIDLDETSLGDFKVHATTGAAAVAIHPFDGGQHCFEIDRPRSGSLHYVCNAEAQSQQIKSSSKQAAADMYTAQLLKVEEPSKCNYRITLHVLALCELSEFMV